jgi:hypothetical protein
MDSNDSNYRKELQRYFYENTKSSQRSDSFNCQYAILFLKKIIIYMITLMKLVNDFLEYKSNLSENQGNKSTISNLVNFANENLIDKMESKIKINLNLIALNIDELIKKFDIRDFCSYLILAHTNIPKKKKQMKFIINHRNKKLKFEFTIKEQINLLSCKVKRKDELIKFSFKFIRRQILKQFQEENKYKLDKSDKQKLKQIFYSKFLNNNSEAIKYFESFDLSRKGLKILSKYSDLKNMMIKFCHSFYIEAMINEYIYRKSDQIFHEDLNFSSFLTEVLSRQHRHSIVVQGVINSLEQFIEFFKV